LFSRFNDEFGKRDLESITPDEILSFLTRLTEGNNQTTTPKATIKPPSAIVTPA
jgi:hypothetical protein